MHAVITRVPGGVWRLVAGPFMYPAEAIDVAKRVLKDTPQGEAIVGYAPWSLELDERENIERARESGSIERVTA